MQQITPKELKRRLQKGESLTLIDVREPYEHEEYNIGGILLPLDTIVQQIDKIPQHQPVVVYCRKGIRSQIAIQRLQEKFSFNNLLNLQGGVEEWKKSEK